MSSFLVEEPEAMPDISCSFLEISERIIENFMLRHLSNIKNQNTPIRSQTVSRLSINVLF